MNADPEVMGGQLCRVGSALRIWRGQPTPGIEQSLKAICDCQKGLRIRQFRLLPGSYFVCELLLDVSVVMDNLPSSRFSPIDVRDAIVGGHRFSSQRIVSALDTKFVG